MIIQRTHYITGQLNEMELPVTHEQLNRWLHSRELIQNVMPHLTPTQREFLITGMTPEQQDKFFINNKLVTNIEFDGIDHQDYPDYCDAFISKAKYNGDDMTEEQLEIINEDREFVYEKLIEHLF
jgi:hypothetical protein